MWKWFVNHVHPQEWAKYTISFSSTNVHHEQFLFVSGVKVRLYSAGVCTIHSLEDISVKVTDPIITETIT